jgi:hypothetical protein
LGFHLQSLPYGGDALAGKPVLQHVPPKADATRRKHPAIGATRRLGTPKGARSSRGTDEPVGQLVSSLGTLWRAVRPTSGTRPSWQREPRPNRPHSSRTRQAERSCLAFTLSARRQAPIEPDGSRPKIRTPRRTLALQRPRPQPNTCRRAVDCGLKRRAGRSKLRPPFCSSPCSLPQTQGLRPTATTSDEHSTRLLRRSGTSEHHPQGEGASPFRSGRISARHSRAQGPSAPEAGPGRRRPSVRHAWHKALHPSCREQAPDASSVLPPGPGGPKLDRSGDQTAHGRRSIRLQDPLQASCARRWKQAPTALPTRPARRNQAQGPAWPERKPCGTEPVPSAQSDQPVLLALKANLHDRRRRPPSLVTTRATSPGSALP